MFESFLSFGHAALLHQLLDAVHHFLQVVLAHLHHVLVLSHFLIRVVLLVLLRLTGQLAQVIVRCLAQFLHQFGDFLIRCPIAHRLGQTVLRALQALQRILKITFFEPYRQIPHGLRNLGLLIVAHCHARQGLDTAHDGAQAQEISAGAEHIVGPMRNRAHQHRHIVGILAVPQQRPAQVDDRAGHRIEEPTPRQGDHFGCRLTDLVRFVGHGQADGDRQIGPWMFGKIVDQRFG